MKKRIAQYPIEPIILNRWSPRALSEELMSNEELMSLFEAARWAASSYNGQPWHFIYSKRNDQYWQTFFKLLVPFNQTWAYNASYLIVVIARSTFAYNNEPSRTHSFDTGAACQNLALQGHSMGLVVHAMEGFDYEKAKLDLSIPDPYNVQAMVAVGKPGEIHNLPEELQKREEPSDRKSISNFIAHGTFKT